MTTIISIIRSKRQNLTRARQSESSSSSPSKSVSIETSELKKAPSFAAELINCTSVSPSADARTLMGVSPSGSTLRRVSIVPSSSFSSTDISTMGV